MRDNPGMKKAVRHILPLAVLALVSCGTGTEGSLGKGIYKVQFFDDTPGDPQLVAYSYVVEGRDALDTIRYVGDNQYDYLSHSEKRPEVPGNYKVFDNWVGTYSIDPSSSSLSSSSSSESSLDGQPVDLTNVRADCDVYATFREESYSIVFSQSDRGETIRSESGDALTMSLSYGDPWDPEFLLDGTKEDYAPYGMEETFLGHSFGSLVDALESGTDLKAIDSLLESATWHSGEGEPTLSDCPEGSFYLGLPAEDHANPTSDDYPLYFRYLDEFYLLGNMGQAAFVDLQTLYLRETREFPVYVYEDETLANCLGTLYVPYTEALGSEATEGGWRLFVGDAEVIVQGATDVKAQYFDYVEEGDNSVPGVPGAEIHAKDVAENYRGQDAELLHVMGAIKAWFVY